MFPTSKVYRSHVPSTLWGILRGSTPECSVLSPTGSIHLRAHHWSGASHSIGAS